MAISSATSSSSTTASQCKSPAEALKQLKPESKDQDSESSAVHSFTNGVLGLEDPGVQKPPEDENKSYTAGKVVAALGTIGSIISVLV
jgi:hypothetical protein